MKEPARLDAVCLAGETLGFALDKFHETDALADAALEAVAEFSCRTRLWDDEDGREIMAELTRRSEAAEGCRAHAREKLLWEFCRVVDEAQDNDIAG